MSLIFACAAAVQANDPDPLLWIAAYAVVALQAGAHAWLNTVRPFACFGFALLLGLWSLTLFGNLAGADASVFTSFEMTSSGAEEARECLGLLASAGYLLWLGFGHVSRPHPEAASQKRAR